MSREFLSALSDLVIANTVGEIDEIINSHLLVLIEFGAVWCVPCQRFLPHYIKFAKKHPNIICVKVDVDVDPAVISEYKIQSVPQVMLFVNGKHQRTLPPQMTVIKLEQELNL